MKYSIKRLREGQKGGSSNMVSFKAIGDEVDQALYSIDSGAIFPESILKFTKKIMAFKVGIKLFIQYFPVNLSKYR